MEDPPVNAEPDEVEEPSSPPPVVKPPTPRYCKPTKASLNRQERPDTPPEPPLIYPPSKSVMRTTKSRHKYQSLTLRRLRVRVRSKSPRWVPSQVFSPAKKILPPVPRQAIRMPRYIKGEFQSVRKETTPDDSGASESSGLSDFSDSSFEIQPSYPKSLAFGQALPELHNIITAYRKGIDLAEQSVKSS